MNPTQETKIGYSYNLTPQPNKGPQLHREADPVRLAAALDPLPQRAVHDLPLHVAHVSGGRKLVWMECYTRRLRTGIINGIRNLPDVVENPGENDLIRHTQHGIARPLTRVDEKVVLPGERVDEVHHLLGPFDGRFGSGGDKCPILPLTGEISHRCFTGCQNINPPMKFLL